MPSWIGPWEIAIVVVIALLIFGPKKLPDLGSSLGKSISGFKTGLKEAQDEMKTAMKEDAEAPASAEAPVATTATAATAALKEPVIAAAATTTVAEPEHRAELRNGAPLTQSAAQRSSADTGQPAFGRPPSCSVATPLRALDLGCRPSRARGTGPPDRPSPPSPRPTGASPGGASR